MTSPRAAPGLAVGRAVRAGPLCQNCARSIRRDPVLKVRIGPLDPAQTRILSRLLHFRVIVVYLVVAIQLPVGVVERGGGGNSSGGQGARGSPPFPASKAAFAARTDVPSKPHRSVPVDVAVGVERDLQRLQR